MIRSKLLEGLQVEDAEAARGQVWAFDHATVLGEVNRRALRGQAEAPSDGIRHARDDGLVIPMDADGWRAAKLARMLKHLGIRFDAAPTGAALLDLCLEAEEKAVTLLARLQGPGKAGKGQTPFQGRDVTQLAQYVLRRLFEDLDAGFVKKPPEEQERIAADIAHALSELPDHVRERIRTEAGLSDLSTAALKRTGAIAAVGGAMASTVGMAGFAAYTTLTSTIAAVAGLFGMTLPFAVYVKATSMLAFAANPMLTGPLAVVAGGVLVIRANRQMRDRLLPVLVATAILAEAEGRTGTNASVLADCLARAHASAAKADRKERSVIEATFPCLAV